MPSLKEVKTRISSVKSTRKITSAMKMVASSKLHHAQKAIEAMHPYQQKLMYIMHCFINKFNSDISSPYLKKRNIKNVAIIVYTSNSSLCGAFNGNTIKELNKIITEYQEKNISVRKIITLGRKGEEAVKKIKNIQEKFDVSDLVDHPDFNILKNITNELMKMYKFHEIDKVDLIYHKFISTGSQTLLSEELLPINLQSKKENHKEAYNDYIIEPSIEELMNDLIPKCLHLKVYTALLDNLASEQAARVIAMQIATDNANDLLYDLTLQYNKSRQFAITAELLDILGGSMNK